MNGEPTARGHVFGYQVTDRPRVWLRVIAPADNLESLFAHLQEQFRGRLVAVRNESNPAAVLVVNGDACRPVSPAAPVRACPRARHRWQKLEVHHYRCSRCEIERRNWLNPDSLQWFVTFAAPGGEPRRSRHTPPCAGGNRNDGK